MQTSTRNNRAALTNAVMATLVLGILPAIVTADNFIKADNNDALNTDTSYVGGVAPGTGDTIVFDSTYNQAGSPQIQVGTGGVVVDGIVFDASMVSLPVINSTGGAGITLGAGGLSKPTTKLIRISSAPVTLSANQTWDLSGTGGTLRWGSDLTTGGNTLLIQGAGTLELQGSQVLGSDVTITNAQVSVSGSGDPTFGGSNTFDTLSIVSGTAIGSTFGDYGVASNFGDGGTNTVITLGGSSTVGTLQYNGLTASSNRDFKKNAPNLSNAGLANGMIEVTSPGQTLTLSGALTATSSTVNSGWALGGDGNIIVTSDFNDQGNDGLTSLRKFGDGIVQFNGAVTLAGTTEIEAGSLLINGAHTGAGAYTVNSPGTLGGNGTIDGAVNVLAGGFINPGASTGVLGVDSATIAGTLKIEIDDSSAPKVDLLNVTGVLDITAATLDFDVTGLAAEPVYVLATYGTLTGGSFASITDLPPDYSINYNYLGTGNTIAIVAIPEPASLGLLAMTGLGLLRRRRA